MDPYFDVVGVTFANGMLSHQTKTTTFFSLKSPEVLNHSLSGVFLAYGDAPYHTGAIYSSTNGTAWKLYSNISLDISYSIDQIDSISQGPGSSLFATVDLYASSSIGVRLQFSHKTKTKTTTIALPKRSNTLPHLNRFYILI